MPAHIFNQHSVRTYNYENVGSWMLASSSACNKCWGNLMCDLHYWTMHAEMCCSWMVSVYINARVLLYMRQVLRETDVWPTIWGPACREVLFMDGVCVYKCCVMLYMRQVLREPDVWLTIWGPACREVLFIDGVCALAQSSCQHIFSISILLGRIMMRMWVHQC